jgi:magnesium transporter
MEDVADETLARIAGTGEEFGEDEPIIRRMLARAPWLMVTSVSGLTAATSLLHFGGASWYVFVPAFVPLITGLSGALGLQCSTVLVRSMATGELSPGTKGDAMAREAVLGASLGLFLGVICGIVVYMLNTTGVHQVGPSPVVAGVIVSAGVFAAALTSTTIGVSMPFIFARWGIDPAVAAGPIVTALNDVSSMLVYCLVAFGLSTLLVG